MVIKHVGVSLFEGAFIVISKESQQEHRSHVAGPPKYDTRVKLMAGVVLELMVSWMPFRTPAMQC